MNLIIIYTPSSFLIKNSMHLLKLRDYKCSNNFEEEEEKKLIINAMMNTKDKHYL